MCARSGTHGTPGRLQIGHITATRPIRMPAPQRIPPGLLHGPCRVAIPGQWWLPRLRGPVRLALLEVLTFRGPLTATEAGQLIEESPTTCSFHLRQLAKYGFVEEAGGEPVAGGTVVDDEQAPSFWVLADSDGNHLCLCTWQGRD